MYTDLDPTTTTILQHILIRSELHGNRFIPEQHRPIVNRITLHHHNPTSEYNLAVQCCVLAVLYHD
jgi:hypothetical protein